MGHVAGAALVSHQRPDAKRGYSEDGRRRCGFRFDQLAARRAKDSKDSANAVIIFDCTGSTGYNLIDGGERYSGNYISDEMPWYLYGVPYDYRGHPNLCWRLTG